MNKIFISLLYMTFSFSIDALSLKKLPKNPFSYDLGIKVIPSNKKDDKVTICCHGYGHNNQIIDVLKSYHVPLGHMIGFNFPKPELYGTPDEILPLVYLLKYYVCDMQVSAMNLYGFSAGGGVIINALACLVNNRYDDRLKALGITHEHTKKIIEALKKGYIILDCPLKSFEEVVAYRGKSPELEVMAHNFAKNNVEPINTLTTLHDLDVTMIVYFENPDAVLSNRDDQVFVDRLRAANKGKTVYLTGYYGGHTSYHKKLWDYLKQDL